MAKSRKLRNVWALWAIGLAVAVLAAAGVASTSAASALVLALRAFALVGYQLVFWAILSSAFVPQLVRSFGRPFVKIHHLASISGLACITLHPILAAVESGSADVFLPRFDSLVVFLTLGGRAAWYLVAIAVAAAFVRQRIGARWRAVHGLNYLAFALATAHANLLGGNFQSPALRVGSWALVAEMLAVFAWRRLWARRTARRGA